MMLKLPWIPYFNTMGFENPTNQQPDQTEKKKDKLESKKPRIRKIGQTSMGAFADWESRQEEREDRLRELRESQNQ